MILFCAILTSLGLVGALTRRGNSAGVQLDYVASSSSILPRKYQLDSDQRVAVSHRREMESTGLERIVVVADGAIKAHFCDGTLLLLSPKGEFYEHVSDDGSPARHLINCALRRHSQRLRQVLAFRNLYFRDSIYTSWVMEDESRNRSIDLPYSVPPQWPATVQEGLDQGLICLSGALVSLRSVDGVHRIVYDTIGRRLSVSYPQKIPIGTGEGKSQSILEDKVFSVHDVPNEWIPPLRVTLAAYKRFFDLGIEDLKELGEIERAIAFREGTASDSTSYLTESRRLEFESGWWYSNTTIMPDGEQIALAWTENVLYQFIGSTNEAQAWIRQDDSYLETVQNGRFVRHRSGRFDRLYAASATPSEVTTPESEVLYSVASIVEHLCAIR